MRTKKFQLRMFRKLIFLALVVSIRCDENIEKPVAEGRVALEPVSVEPVSAEPVSVEPMSVELVSMEPVSVEPVSVEPMSVELVSAEPMSAELLANSPIAQVLVSGGPYDEDEDEDENVHENVHVAKEPSFNLHTLPPPLVSGEPVKVNISATVFEYAVDTDKQLIEVGMIFRQEWNDIRLSYKSSDPTHFHRIEEQRSIWTPDLYFANELSTFRFTVVEPNGFIRIFPNGDVLMSRRVYVKTKCALNLKAYPYDTQNCELLIESYSYSTSEMALRWNDSHKVVDFKSGRSEEFSAELYYRSSIMDFKDSQYETFVIEFKLKRIPYTIMFRIILPVSVYLMLSWTSFFFNPLNHNLRIMLCVLPLIAFLLQINFSKNFFVQVGYPTGLDLWTYFCFLLMNAAFFEFVFVFWRAEKKKIYNIKMGKDVEETDNPIDYVARILFLFSYAAFNLVCAFYIYYTRL